MVVLLFPEAIAIAGIENSLESGVWIPPPTTLLPPEDKADEVDGVDEGGGDLNRRPLSLKVVDITIDRWDRYPGYMFEFCN